MSGQDHTQAIDLEVGAAKTATAKKQNSDSDIDGGDAKDKKKDETPPMVPLSAMFRYASTRDKVYMVIGTLCALASGATWPLWSVLFGDLLDGLNKTEAEIIDGIRSTIIWWVIIGFGSLITSWAAIWLWMSAAESQVQRLRQEFVKATLKQNIGFFDSDDGKPGSLSFLLQQKTVDFRDAIADKVGAAFMGIGQLLFGLIIGFVKGWELALVVLAMQPLTMFGFSVFAMSLQKSNVENEKAYKKANSIAQQAIQMIRTVTAFGNHQNECDRYEAHLADAAEVEKKKGIASGAAFGFSNFVMFSSYSLSLWYGAKLIRDGAINDYTGLPWTGGDVMGIFFAILIGGMALGQIAPPLAALTNGRAAAVSLFRIIDRPSAIDSSSDEGKKPQLQGRITLKNVKFSYPSRPEQPALRGLSVNIEPGQKVALVGASGSGKSTVVQLLERFYDASSGEILVDGFPLADLNVKWWRSQVGLVSQEPVLLDGTIADNIRLGKPDATRQEIEEAARAANAFDFISSLDSGFDTRVGEAGSSLSGGQKQRVAIARAVIKNPAILLLDEATSALDSTSEKVVQDALDQVAQKRTTLIIAHRLSTIRDVDVIVALEEGQVAEFGTHDQLMDQNGIYAALVKAQQSGDDDKEPEVIEVEEDDLVDVSLHSTAVTISQKASTDGVIAVEGKSDDSEASKDGDEDEDKDRPIEQWKVSKVPMSRVIALISNSKAWTAFAIFGSFLAGVGFPLWAIAFGDVTATLYEPDPEVQKERMVWIALAFVGIGLLTFISVFIQQYAFAVVGNRLTLILRSRSLRAITSMHIGWFDEERHSTSILVGKLASEAQQVQGAATVQVGKFFEYATLLVCGLIVSFVYSWQLALVTLGCLPIMIGAMHIQMKVMTGFAGEGKKLLESADQVSGEAFSQMRMVASFTSEQAVYDKYSGLLVEPVRIGKRAAFIAGAGFGFSQAVIIFIYALCFYVGAVLAEDGVVDLQDIMTSIFAIMAVGMGIAQSAMIAPDFAKASQAKDEIFHLLDSVPDIDPNSTDGLQPASCQGMIEFDKVRFRYPTRPDHTILRGLSFTAHPGQTVGLVGASGAGKSSVVALIERFYDPEQGDIKLDGTSIKDLNVGWLRSQIGFVNQEPSLFDLPVENNVKYGKSNADRTEVMNALTAANISKEVSCDTPCGLGGKSLSGGQKQRVAIARAIVRQPKILLLDEATSALDNKSEKLVQEAIDRLASQGDQTTIVIAHRLSTIRKCDVILFVQRGEIIESGSHDELMNARGAYFQLVQSGQRTV